MLPVRPVHWFSLDPAAGLTIWDYRSSAVPLGNHGLRLSVRVPFRCLLCRRREIYEWVICGVCSQRVRSGFWVWLTQFVEDNVARRIWCFLY